MKFYVVTRRERGHLRDLNAYDNIKMDLNFKVDWNRLNLWNICLFFKGLVNFQNV